MGPRHQLSLLTVALASLAASPRAASGQAVADAVIDSAQIASSGARTLAELLAARVPGVSVTWLSGAPGIAPMVSVRGAVGGTGSGRPQLIVDGVLMRDDEHWLSTRPDWHRPAHHWSLPVEELARVEVILGASGGIQVDEGSSRGAVLVTTKRSASGEWTQQFSAASWYVPPGTAVEGIRTNTGTLSAGGTTNRCTLRLRAQGDCIATGYALQRPYAGDSPFAGAVGSQLAATIGGGFLGGATRVGIVAERNPSQLQTALDRLDLSLSDQRALGDRVNFDATLRLAAVQGEYAAHGSMRALGHLEGFPSESTWLGPDADGLRESGEEYEALRGTARAAASVSLRRDERVGVSLGVERLTRESKTRNLANTTRAERTVLTAGATYSRRAGASERWQRRLDAGVTLRDYVLDESRPGASIAVDARTASAFAQYALGHRDRRFAEVGVRRDAVEDADEFDAFKIPLKFAALRWEISEEGWMPRVPGVGHIELSGRYGEASDFSAFLDAALGIYGGVPGGLSAERAQEREAQIMLRSSESRVTFLVRWFERDVRDGNIEQNANIGSGFTTTLVSEIPTQTAGREIAVRFLTPLSAATLESSLWYASSRSQFGRLAFGSGGAPLGGAGFLNHSSGDAYGSLLEIFAEFEDVNGDGVLTDSEFIGYGSTLVRRRTAPTQTLGATSVLKVRERWSVGATLDGKAGHRRASELAYLRCTYRLCPEQYDESTPLSEQAQIERGELRTWDGSFLRLRELWVRHEFNRGALAGASLSIIGQNLLTLARFPGEDPEATTMFAPGILMGEIFQQPIAPMLTLRVDWRGRE